MNWVLLFAREASPGGLTRHAERRADLRPGNAPPPRLGHPVAELAIHLRAGRGEIRQVREQFFVRHPLLPASHLRHVRWLALDDVDAKPHALVTDEHAGACDHRADFGRRLPAERADNRGEWLLVRRFLSHGLSSL